MKDVSTGNSWSIGALLADWVGIDPRALAAFRISMASILLVDLAIRACHVVEFYAEGGFFPFAAAQRWHGTRWSWSFHLLEGSAEFQSAMLLLAAGLAVAMLVGYRTTLATIGSWAMLVSLHNRVPMLLNGGDVLFRMLMFWAMFVPLGRVWSLDAWLRNARRRRRGEASSVDEGIRPVVSLGGAALLLQLCLMYFFTGLFKHNRDWLSGDSMYYVFSFDAYGRPLGRFLLQFPLLCRVITWSTLWLELLGPGLVLLPWPWLKRLAELPEAAAAPRWLRGTLSVIGQTARPALVLAFLGMHVGIELTMTVGLFSYVSVAGWLMFLPAAVWDGRFARWLMQRLRRGQATPRLPATPFAEPQGVSPSEQGAPPNERQGAPLRTSIARKTARLALAGLHGVACALPLGFVVWYNVATLRKNLDDAMPKSVSRFSSPLVLGQKWDMFSRPTRDDGWFVARATLGDGSAVDLLRGGVAVNVAKPADVAGMFPNHRWRKFYRQLVDDDYRSYRADVARYLGRAWNERHGGGRRAVRVELIYYREKTLLDPRKMRVEPVELARVELPAPAAPQGDAQDGATELATTAERSTAR